MEAVPKPVVVTSWYDSGKRLEPEDATKEGKLRALKAEGAATIARRETAAKEGKPKDQISKEAALIEQRLSGREWANPTDDTGRPYVRSLQSDLMIHLPAYVQNYLFATATEASLWDAATKAMDDPVGNAKLGPWLRDNLVVPVSTEDSFPDQLAEFTGQSDFTAPLAEYLRSKVD